MLKIILFIFYFSFSNFNLNAETIGSDSGYKIPRFVSLKSNESNLRIGSSKNYPIVLKYTVKNLPIEIVDEYDAWRKISDNLGNQGWIHRSLLKGDRFALIKKKNQISTKIYSNPMGIQIGEIGKLNIVKIKICLKNWCKISFDKYNGWINKENLWGIYKYETINIPFYQPLINQVWKIKFYLRNILFK